MELDVLSGSTKVAAATLVDPAIAISADDTPVVNSAVAVDLLMPSQSAAGYISGAQAISVGLPATMLYRVATAEYDLRPLGDDPASDGEGDELLVDVLAESALAALSEIVEM